MKSKPFVEEIKKKAKTIVNDMIVMRFSLFCLICWKSTVKVGCHLPEALCNVQKR